MIYFLIFLGWVYIGFNKLTYLEIDKLESSNYFTFSEVIKIILFWPWQGKK